ncbi:Prefoldin beta-like protein [Trametopsis cervina]|nr:Prefoldin beta-like protein [Trametopsis cervina]
MSAGASLGALQDKLQLTSQEYQKLQLELSAVVDARQKLDAQLQENEAVKKEFASLSPNNVVYKMIGPVLVPQDQTEAKGNVDKRLEFIQSDIKRVEAQLKDLGEKSERKKMEVRHTMSDNKATFQTALQGR